MARRFDLSVLSFPLGVQAMTGSRAAAGHFIDLKFADKSEASVCCQPTTV